MMHMIRILVAIYANNVSLENVDGMACWYCGRLPGDLLYTLDSILPTRVP